MQTTTDWQPGKRSAAWALLLLIPAPTLGLLVTLLGPKTDAGQATLAAKAVWVFSKAWIMLLPVLWHWRIDRQTPRMPRPRWAGMPAALITGSLIFAIIAAGYYTFAHGWIDPTETGKKMADAGLNRVWLYVAMAVYWCTLNSLLEEYVWRWFVFTRCEALMNRYVAVVAAALFFTLHHVVALAVYFDDLKVVVFASLGVFIGGATWSWIYLKYRNIYAAYVSHVFADIIIFWIGYELIFVAAH